MDPTRIKKWKETVACGVIVGRVPSGGGVQGMLGQEAEVLPAGVVEGVGHGEARIEEEEG